MPFFKNLVKEVCQVLEPEVKVVLEAGWKELNAAEEALYREGLRINHDLTSAVSIEAARVKAGLYEILGHAVSTAEDVAATEAPKIAAAADAAAAAVDKAAKKAAKKPSAKKAPAVASDAKPADQTAANASEPSTLPAADATPADATPAATATEGTAPNVRSK